MKRTKVATTSQQQWPFFPAPDWKCITTHMGFSFLRAGSKTKLLQKSYGDNNNSTQLPTHPSPVPVLKKCIKTA